MIWFALALFALSFIATVLLTPKPEFEDARAGSLNDINFPRATENAPIPLVLGKVRMQASNTTWYGNFVTEPIKEKMKTGLFSSTKVIVGYEYFLGLDLALAMGPGIQMTELFIDDKSAWTGTTSATVPTNITIDAPEHFGGYKEGGGWSGSAKYYPGGFSVTSNPVNAYLETHNGVGNVPGYIGTAHIVFEDNNIGEAANLKKLAFVLEGYTNDLGITGSGKVGVDMNPAEAIYQIMTDDWRGMGVAAADIDTAALVAIGETLYTEGNGVSILVTAETNGKRLIVEILRQIDAISYQDPATGKITFKLIRKDYTPSALTVYDEDDIVKITNFGRTGWEDVVSQMKITFPQRDKESDAVAVSQDGATANMLGRLRSSTMAMPFLYDKDLANVIATRERSQLSIPLFRVTMEMNRSANILRPGTVFKLSWAQYGFSELIMRVQSFDLGELLKGKIVIRALQDDFSSEDTVFAPPADSAWVAPVVDPIVIPTQFLVEMPRWYQLRLFNPLTDGFAGVAAMALKPASASSAFDLLIGTATGVLDARDPQAVEYAATGLLTVIYDQADGIATGIDTTTGMKVGTISGVFESAANLAELRTGEFGILYVDGEWMGILGTTDNLDTTFQLTSVHRGLFGSQVKTHAIGTRVWQVNPEMFGSGALSTLGELSTLYYKMLDKVGPRTISEASVSEASQVMTDIADRPLRGRNVQIDAVRTGIDIIDAVTHPATWVISDRELTNQVTIEQDATQTADQAETYDVDIFVGGVRNATLSGVGVTSPYAIPFNLTSITNTNCECRVYARRTGGDTKLSIAYGMIEFQMHQP